MPLPAYTATRTNQRLGSGDELALIIPEFEAEVESVARRQSVTEGFINMQSIRGTATLVKNAIGETDLQTLTPGSTPDGTVAQFSDNHVTVDTVVLARNIQPLLDSFQNKFDTRMAVAQEQGKKIGKFKDNSVMIQAAKASLLSTSAYGNLPGFQGGNTYTFGAAGDALDPNKYYMAIGELVEKMELKDVDIQADGCVLFLSPTEHKLLLESDYIINGEYLTSDGSVVQGQVFKAWGIPVRKTNNIPRTNITSHLLNTSRNSNAYNGDFTKLRGLLFSPKALLAGATIDLTSDVWFDKMSKQWFIDSWLSYALTPDRAEWAGSIWIP